MTGKTKTIKKHNELNKVIHSPSELKFDWNSGSKVSLQTNLDAKRNNLEKVKANPLYPSIRHQVLPYTSLKSRFVYQDALKVAEIDMIYKVCPRNPILTYVPSLIAYSFSQRTNTADIGGGPGGFTEYVQFRYPNAITGGMTKRISNQDDGWDIETLDPHRIIRFPGEDYSGDILTQWGPFIEMLQGQFVDTLEFISGTAKSDNSKVSDVLAWFELYIILLTIQDGANAVIRLHTSWSQLMMEVIYVATQTFDKVFLFQPLVSGNDSDEIFLIMKNALSEKRDYYLSMSRLMSRIPAIEEIESILSSDLPQEFIDYIFEFKEEFVETQIKTLETIQSYFKLNQENTNQKVIDIKLKLLEWALPDA